MNKARRTALLALVADAQILLGKIEDLKGEFETQRDEEQDYFDAMPESFQSGDKGSVAEEAIQNIDNAIDALGEAYDAIDTVSSFIDDATV